jgi:SAM-dependent methyltransferase
MTDEPVTWFHGLIAERVAEFCPDATQVPFFQREIRRYGQPALDLGCGTGRLLLPLLRAGLDIDGCDISVDMLRHCRQKAAALGLKPQLYQQPMHALDLPRNYRTIFICASFNLAGSRDNGLATLRRCYSTSMPSTPGLEVGRNGNPPGLRICLNPGRKNGPIESQRTAVNMSSSSACSASTPWSRGWFARFVSKNGFQESWSNLKSTPSTEPCTCLKRCCSCCKLRDFVRSPFGVITAMSQPHLKAKS